MTTHTFKMHLYQIKFEYMTEPQWYLADSEGLGKESPDWIYIGPREIELDVPGFADMRDHQIKKLREEEKKARADFQERITQIQARINNLLALEMA